jgi:hypothetical protein
VKGDLNGGLASFDAVGAKLEQVTPTATWTQYRLDIAGIDYNIYVPQGGVRGAFSFVLTRDLTNESPQILYVDGIEWVKEASLPGAGGAGGAAGVGGASGAADTGAGAGGAP